MFSSSRLVTHGLLSLLLPVGKELVGCEVVQGLVRADVVVDVLPLQQGLVEGGDLQVAIVDLIELLRVSALTPYPSTGLGLRGGRINSLRPRT